MRIQSASWSRTALSAVLLLALGLLAAPTAAQPERRVALVVGNSAYAHIGRLPNPGNDAGDMSAALRRLGFEVTTELDADHRALNDALRAFTRRSVGAAVSLVFYAGHGMEMDGVNYLLPVDARLQYDTDVRYETVTLDDVMAATTGASLRVVILDACRDNPLARSMQRTVSRRSVSRGSFGDLNEDLLGDETLVAYAAAAGTTAADGTGRNSPYTSALLAHLEEPLELVTLFRRVRARVLASTGGEQRPHEYQSLVGDHYLRRVPGRDPRTIEAALGLDRTARRRVQRGLAAAGFPPGPADGVFGAGTRAAIRRWQASRGVSATGYLAAAGASALGVSVPSVTESATAGGTVADNAPAAVQAQQETVFWQSIADSENPADYRAYLEQFPTGVFARLALNRLAELGGPPSSAASDPPRPAASDPTPSSLRAGDVFRDCEECPELVVVPAGRFRMGCVSGRDCQDNEQPVHEVQVASFALGVHEVTFEEYDRFVQATGHRRPNDHWGRGGQPVLNVSWEDAEAYVAWLSRETGESYRLPSESEWEYAARAGTTTRYSWGQDIGRNRANCRGCGSRWDGAGNGAGGFVRAERLGPARHARERVGVGGGLLARELRAGAARRLGVDERCGLWSPCVARRFLGTSIRRSCARRIAATALPARAAATTAFVFRGRSISS